MILKRITFVWEQCVVETVDRGDNLGSKTGHDCCMLDPNGVRDQGGEGGGANVADWTHNLTTLGQS